MTGVQTCALPISEITEEEKPVEVHLTWEWNRLGDFISLMDAGWSPQCEKHPVNDDRAWGVLKTTAVQVNEFNPNENKALPTHLEARPEYSVSKGDVLITRAGPKHRVGICCVVDRDIPYLMISDKIIRMRFMPGLYLPEFIPLVLSYGWSADCIEEKKSGMAYSQMNISQPKLRMIPVPVLPLEEQAEIVRIGNELLTRASTLESLLQKNIGTSISIADSIMARNN